MSPLMRTQPFHFHSDKASRCAFGSPAAISAALFIVLAFREVGRVAQSLPDPIGAWIIKAAWVGVAAYFCSLRNLPRAHRLGSKAASQLRIADSS